MKKDLRSGSESRRSGLHTGFGISTKYSSILERRHCDAHNNDILEVMFPRRLLDQEWRFTPKAECSKSTVNFLFSCWEFVFVFQREEDSTKVGAYSAQSDLERKYALFVESANRSFIHLWVHLVEDSEKKNFNSHATRFPRAANTGYGVLRAGHKVKRR